MSEEHYYWRAMFLEECGIVLSEYQDNRAILNKAILEKHLDDFINTANKSGDISAHQTLTVLILQVGAKLPSDLKEKVLESLKWENDNKRYHWSPYVINVRKVYLEDFKQKIISYRNNNASFLINLRRIQDDKELEKISIGLEQLNSYSKLETFEKINYINLDSCELTEVPEEVFKFSNLSILSLDNNKIKDLPSNLGDLILLKSIYLSYNYIESLPSSLGNLKNLRLLYLKNNNLESIPDTFKTLKCIFYLQNNPMKDVPVFLKENSKYKKIFYTKH